jgi:hypothetical protein
LKRFILTLFLSILVLMFFQCKKKQDVTADKEAIRQAVINDNNWFNSNTSTDSTNDTTSMKLGSDTILFWWRGVQTHDDPTINISVVGDSALVDWSRHNYGDLNLLIKVPDTTSLQLWVKKVYETAQVRGVFRRTGDTKDSLRGWVLQKISLATGLSDSVSTVKIDSLRIQSESNPNLLINDPLNSFYRIDSLPYFRPAEPVTITLYTNIAAGNAFLHTFILSFPYYVRLRFNNIGNGVFTGTWNAQLIPFPRFAIFDLMNHQTLFMPPGSYGYDFCGWLFPYQIKSTDK